MAKSFRQLLNIRFTKELIEELIEIASPVLVHFF